MVIIGLPDSNEPIRGLRQNTIMFDDYAPVGDDIKFLNDGWYFWDLVKQHYNGPYETKDKCYHEYVEEVARWAWDIRWEAGNDS
jgi:hypothetical protein